VEQVLFKEKDGHYFFIIPDRGIIASGKSLEEAYCGLNKKKKALDADFVALDISLDQLQVNEKVSSPYHKQLKRNIFVISIIAIIIFSATGVIVANGFKRDFKRLTTKLDHKFESAIDPTRTKRVKRIDRFKKKMETLAPYVKELKQVWNEN